jgi:HEPN domain-containing protein
MQFTAEHYYRAARERIIEASILYDRQRHGLSMYVAGLAVECLLRAFRARKDAAFDSRHDLQLLFRQSGILRLHEDRLESLGYEPEEIQQTAAEFRAAHNEVVRLWRNDLRFAAERHLRGWLNDMGAYDRVKGDVLKANARKLLAAAQGIVNTGVYLWTSKKK